MSIAGTISSYLNRRPHRSFRLTKRRDYARSLTLPGYISFTRSVHTTLWQQKKIFLLLSGLYAVLTVILIGIGSQDTYAALTSTLQSTGADIFKGNTGEIGQAALLFVSLASSGLSATPNQSQQIYAAIVGLLVWLTTVWLLRNILAGHKIRLRDGLYSAGAPILPTFLVALLLLIQLIPIALAVIGFSAASTSGLLAGGVEALLFWIAAGLLGIMSLYWVASTAFALIIVTLPGMYPMQAIRTAGDMVVGRRLRILLRIVWMFGCILVAWAIVLIPFILIDAGIKHLIPAIAGAPIVPVVLMLLSVMSFVWSASYIYLLYRKVVEDDARPA